MQYTNSYYNNPYLQYPYNYQQAMQRQNQMMPQPQMAQSQVPLQPNMAQYEIPLRETKFTTSEEAKAYIVMPNSASLLIDKQQGLAYLKSADNMGQSFMECYSFAKLDGNGEIKPKMTEITGKEQEPINLSDYIKKDEIKAFKFATMEDIQRLSSKIDKLIRNQGGNQNGATKQQ